MYIVCVFARVCVCVSVHWHKKHATSAVWSPVQVLGILLLVPHWQLVHSWSDRTRRQQSVPSWYCRRVLANIRPEFWCSHFCIMAGITNGSGHSRCSSQAQPQIASQHSSPARHNQSLTVGRQDAGCLASLREEKLLTPASVIQGRCYSTYLKIITWILFWQSLCLLWKEKTTF